MALALLILGVALLCGLLLVPVGLPGLWLMLAAGLAYRLVEPTGGIGIGTLIGVAALVLAAEIFEFSVSARFTRRYGGSRRASWGAILGGLIGAVVGVPVPIVGSVVGAFGGAFVGALLAEMTVKREERGDPTRVATGAVIGRAIGAAGKVAIGAVVACWIMAVAMAG